ncbi:DUF1998 domain-containing protein [Arthrobacter mangrovi]|uniref:MrfA-like Zn-binding domain-containing protein n=1 Tax=Arthrobacter mangrovi TaxID=2966350 RepID=A0ABQ5MPM8_9MICC|nr:DUF1998 domain-containing protein [Arthrobacter mangrovi]GLB65928.1 hypothetical protein AHIS1636_03670 [Arthrobacter mangrovi]
MARTNYAARRAQLISTFGVGSLFPAENNSFMITSTDQWDEKRLKRVSEPRLARNLRVNELCLPPSGKSGHIPVVRFPDMLVCPRCNRLGNLRELKSRYDDPVCGLCSKKGELAPSRFVVACENGHLDDFPYAYWVHSYNPEDRENHKLSLISEGRTSSLADIIVRCSCGKARSMADAFNPLMLKEMRCGGNRPWLGWGYREKGCDKQPKTVQRGASNVWFPAVRSAISIPPYSEFLSRLVTQRAPQLSNPKILEPVAEFLLEDIVKEFQGRFSLKELRSEIERQFHGGEEDELSEKELREQEFLALMNGRQDNPDSEFVAEVMSVPEKHCAWIQAVRKVTRLREVRALYGFSRLFPREQNPEAKLSPLYPEDNVQHWLPAIETLGEGLFIALDREQVDAWAATKFARSRYEILKRNADQAAAARNTTPVPVDIVQVLLHTLSHMVIDQLALDAGYPASSIRERIYISEEQCGVLLYTATADSAGSLGGIAAQAHADRLGAALSEGIERTSWCSADPVCIESQGSGTDARNLAACHCCVLLPETSCELFNSELDRACLFGIQGQEAQGFFAWAESSGHRPQTGDQAEETGIVVPPAIEDSKWESIYLGEPKLRELIEEIADADVPVAEWGQDAGLENQWQIDLSWRSEYVAVLIDKNAERDEWLEDQGWNVFHLDDYAPSDLAHRISQDVY